MATAMQTGRPVSVAGVDGSPGGTTTRSAAERVLDLSQDLPCPRQTYLSNRAAQLVL